MSAATMRDIRDVEARCASRRGARRAEGQRHAHAIREARLALVGVKAGRERERLDQALREVASEARRWLWPASVDPFGRPTGAGHRPYGASPGVRA